MRAEKCGRQRSDLGQRPLTGWSGRAPAAPAIEVGKGRQRQGARHVSSTARLFFFSIDIGKNSFHVVGLDARGAIAWGRVARQRAMQQLLANSRRAGVYCVTPLTATMLNFAYFMPISWAATKSGESFHAFSASRLSQRRMTTGPFGRSPSITVPGPAAT